MLEEQKNIFRLIETKKTKIKNSRFDLYSTRKNIFGRIIYAGAGTSARIAAQDGSELKPTFDHNRIEYVIAGGNKALLRSIEGAEDNIKEAQLRIKKLKINKNDVLIAVSASGTITLEAVKKAAELKALTIAIVNNNKTKLEDHGYLS